MDDTQAFIAHRSLDDRKSCCACLPRGRGKMIILVRCGKEDLMLGPHWFMLICTFLIVIGLSVVIYGVVLNDRDAVRGEIGNSEAKYRVPCSHGCSSRPVALAVLQSASRAPARAACPWQLLPMIRACWSSALLVPCLFARSRHSFVTPTPPP